MRTNYRVTVIIPCYNEMRTVGSVIEIAYTWQHADQIIVIDDGSTDRTAEVLRQFGKSITVISNRVNLGKGHAIGSGIKYARRPILVFLDADTCGLTHKYLDALVKPIVNNESDMSLGMVRFFRLPAKGPRREITGFRAIRKSVLSGHLSEIRTSRYGVEVLMNSIVGRSRMTEVDLPHVFILDKFVKTPGITTVFSYMREGWELFVQILKNIARRLTNYAYR